MKFFKKLILYTLLNILARHFICRALLAVNNMFDATEILQDEGFGISSGLSINMMFSRQEGVPGLGVPIIHNAEVAPSIDDTSKESQLSVLSLSCGEYLTVCNKYSIQVH